MIAMWGGAHFVLQLDRCTTSIRYKEHKNELFTSIFHAGNSGKNHKDGDIYIQSYIKTEGTVDVRGCIDIDHAVDED